MPNSATALALVDTAMKCLATASSPPLSPRPCQQPVPGRRRVGQRLERGEGLGADDEQRGGRVEVVGGGVQVDRVDVGDEAARQARHDLVGQGLGGHGRAEVRAADADVDDRLDRLPVAPIQWPIADAVGQDAHLRRGPRARRR